MSVANAPKLIEPRWPIILVIVTLGILLSLLPDRVRAFPSWFPYLVAIAMIVPMTALALTTAKARWLLIESVVTWLFFVIAGFGMVDQLTHLLSAMVRHSAEVTGLQLLTSSISVWATNVFTFAIAYWRTDRGGPEARANHASGKPDWLFPQQGVPQDVPPDWRPMFIDYLFLSFCTATAFSPAEAQPLTARAMVLLMLESIISLITVVAVASRAINILGS